MPPLPDQPNVVRVDLRHTEDADPGLTNRLFFRFSGTDPTISNMNDLAGFVEGFWAAHFAAMCNTSVALVEVVTTDLTSPTSSRGQWTGNTAGTRSGAVTGINECALINMTITRRYRGGKPRMYAPWGTAGDINGSDNQQWAPAFVSAATAAFAAFTGGMNGQGFGSCAVGAHINVSYYQGSTATISNPGTDYARGHTTSTPRTTSVTDTIVAAACNQYIGSQRRRVRA